MGGAPQGGGHRLKTPRSMPWILLTLGLVFLLFSGDGCAICMVEHGWVCDPMSSPSMCETDQDGDGIGDVCDMNMGSDMGGAMDSADMSAGDMGSGGSAMGDASDDVAEGGEDTGAPNPNASEGSEEGCGCATVQRPSNRTPRHLPWLLMGAGLVLLRLRRRSR